MDEGGRAGSVCSKPCEKKLGTVPNIKLGKNPTGENLEEGDRKCSGEGGGK